MWHHACYMYRIGLGWSTHGYWWSFIDWIIWFLCFREPQLNNIGLVLHNQTWGTPHFIIVPMTTGYNIACVMHPSLVSIPFYAIPISLPIIHRIFYLLVSSLFFAAFSKDVDTTVILSSHLESCYGKWSFYYSIHAYFITRVLYQQSLCAFTWSVWLFYSALT